MNYKLRKHHEKDISQVSSLAVGTLGHLHHHAMLFRRHARLRARKITQCLRRLYYVDEVKPATLPVDTLIARVQATLPLTGYYLWLRRLKNRRKRPTRE